MAKFMFTISGILDAESQPSAFHSLAEHLAEIDGIQSLDIKVSEKTVPTGPTPRVGLGQGGGPPYEGQHG